MYVYLYSMLHRTTDTLLLKSCTIIISHIIQIYIYIYIYIYILNKIILRIMLFLDLLHHAAPYTRQGGVSRYVTRYIYIYIYI